MLGDIVQLDKVSLNRLLYIEEMNFTKKYTENGWNIPYCDFYKEDENDEW